MRQHLPSLTAIFLQGAISMNIYTGKDYRKIYEQHYGPIPLDEKGRRYDIHHIDGDHSNIDPSNLKAVTLDEHYDIHYAQGDWGACQAIQMRMDRTSKEISELSRKTQLERMANGTHHFCDTEWRKKSYQKQVERGTHNFSGEAGSKFATERNNRIMAEGKHPFAGGELSRRNNAKKSAENALPSQIRVSCIHCYKEVNLTSLNRAIHKDKICLTRKPYP